MKSKVRFVCQECGNNSSRWLGKYSVCNSWNTYIEELERDEKKRRPSIASRIKTIRKSHCFKMWK